MPPEKKSLTRPSSALAGVLMIGGCLVVAYGALAALNPLQHGEAAPVILGGLMVTGIGGIISWLVETVHELRLTRAQLAEQASHQPQA